MFIYVGISRVCPLLMTFLPFLFDAKFINLGASLKNLAARPML